MMPFRLALALAFALLILAGALVVSPPPVPDIPLARSIEAVAPVPDGWTASSRPGQDILPADRHAGEHLARAFQNGSRTVWVAVDYYPSQREGNRPPAQQLLYPGRGWTDLGAHPVRVPLDAGGVRSFPATLLLMRFDDRHVAVLYWYQIQRRSIASDHGYRAILLYNRLIHRRSDGALVRVGTLVSGPSTPAAVMAGLVPVVQPLHQGLLNTLRD